MDLGQDIPERHEVLWHASMVGISTSSQADLVVTDPPPYVGLLDPPIGPSTCVGLSLGPSLVGKDILEKGIFFLVNLCLFRGHNESPRLHQGESLAPTDGS